jgi:RNA polymerase sigma-70 factor (ECF subfamily)
MAAPHLILVGQAPSGEARDAALVDALIKREAGASFAAWARLRSDVDRTLRRLMGPDSDIDDLAQEVFLRFFAVVSRLRNPEALRSFLFGICLRVTRRERRARWLHRLFRLTDTGDLPETAAAEADAEAREVVRRYYRILDRVGEPGRSLFIARQIEGLPLTEVAAMHGLSLSTTQRHLARAARRIATLVKSDPGLSSYLGERDSEDLA